jgi:hypothetical protein
MLPGLYNHCIDCISIQRRGKQHRDTAYQLRRRVIHYCIAQGIGLVPNCARFAPLRAREERDDHVASLHDW